MTDILKAPNGEWLVVQVGAQDRLLGTAPTRKKAEALKRKFEREAH